MLRSCPSCDGRLAPHSEFGHDLSLNKPEEPFLVIADLVDVKVAIPRINETLDAFDVWLRVGPHRYPALELVSGDGLSCFLELFGMGQLRCNASERGVGPHLKDCIKALLLALRPTHSQLAIAR